MNTSPEEILGHLSKEHKFRVLEQEQINSWRFQIDNLKNVLQDFRSSWIFIEFEIPRIGKRADVVIVYEGNIFVLEYKVGATQYDSLSIEQVYDYALDLKNFHKESHALKIIPILIATEAPQMEISICLDYDDVAKPIKCNKHNVAEVLRLAHSSLNKSNLDIEKWANSVYKPTPTIIEAAQALYKDHKVEDISRSDAGAINLSKTSNAVSAIIEHAKANNKKTICLITGVPGAGKTLAGLNIATSRMGNKNEHAVFLSGNGPLVTVLREALIQDEMKSNKGLPKVEQIKKSDAERKATAFIQNIHHFRDDNLTTSEPPVEKVVVFDEAQRAWNKEQTSSFMKRKRGLNDFDMSEPNFLLSVMDRHQHWCVVICLIGEGQEINTGEAGIIEWISALRDNFSNWEVFSPHNFPELPNVNINPDLHLAVSLRSFRSENLSKFVGYVINGNAIKARDLLSVMHDYPILLTRDLGKAKEQLRAMARGSERIGLVASSNAIRLKPDGVFVKNELDPAMWFLKDKTDIRSSFSLEDVATEFDIQGLEIDWACLCWDANFRMEDFDWKTYNFSGTKWQKVRNEDNIKYVANSYRVLMTRARQGLVIYVPNGNADDLTRLPEFYDGIYTFLKNCGIAEL
jgi:Uncharacterized conserved protein (DUF2075)